MGYTEKKPHNYKVEITKLKMRHMLRLLYGKPTVWIPTVTPPRTGNGSIGNERVIINITSRGEIFAAAQSKSK